MALCNQEQINGLETARLDDGAKQEPDCNTTGTHNAAAAARPK